MGITKKYEDVKNNLLQNGFYLDVSDEDFKGVTLTPLYCHDMDGYRYKVIYDQVMRGRTHEAFIKTNPFVIYNMNLYLRKNNVPFECVEKICKGNKERMRFRCKRCGSLVEISWEKLTRSDHKFNGFRKICPNCDTCKESLHASVLKQMFLNEYEGTVVEDLSYINPETGKARPTDIVNHNLKIAIEVQSQWHDFEDVQIRDALKMRYWIDRGYDFFSPDIRDYTVLEMCQLFFNITKLPDYIDYHYSDGLNAKEIQDLLDKGYNVSEITKITNVTPHQIYDSVKTGKIRYPDNYQRADRIAIIQYTLNGDYIREFSSIKSAADYNNLKAKSLAGALRTGREIFMGYKWSYKDKSKTFKKPKLKKVS